MHRTARFVLAVMTFSAALVWAAVPAQAKGFTINLFSDGKDIKPGDGHCDSNGSKSGDQCTLRAAIMEDDARNDSSSSLSLPSGTYTLTIGGAGEDKAATGDLDITKNMSIIAQHAGQVTIKAGTSFGDRIFDIPSGSPNVTIHGVKISGGKAPGTENGGGIRDLSGASLQLVQVTLSGNSANNGAGLYADTPSGDTINLNIVTSSGNTASAGGGGIDVEGGVKATLNRLTVTGNHAGDGGGLAAFLKTGATGSVVEMGANSSFASNTASGAGGGIDVGRTSASLITVSGNSAANGGGIALVGGGSGSSISGRIEVSGNTASSKGGGIYASGCGTSCGIVFNTNVDSNHAKEGGGIYVTDGLTLSSIGVIKNSTSGGTNGGALFHAGASGHPLKMTNVTINANTGGPVSSGLVITSSATDTITNVTIAGNTGGVTNGIVATGADPQVKNTIVASSKATSCTGTLVSLGHNLESGNSCDFRAGGDIINKDPLLESPADDNGGFTETMRLKDSSTSFSPAIDNGTNTGCAATDAREVYRPLDGDQPPDGKATCDIGAYEDSGITGNADIQLNSPSGSPNPVGKGSNITYTMTILNHNGPKSSTATRVIDILPSTLSFVSCSPSPCGASNGVVTVTLGNMKSGKSFTVKIVAKVSSTTSASQINNTVSVYSDNPDHYPHNNTATITVKVSQ